MIRFHREIGYFSIEKNAPKEPFSTSNKIHHQNFPKISFENTYLIRFLGVLLLFFCWRFTLFPPNRCSYQPLSVFIIHVLSQQQQQQQLYSFYSAQWELIAIQRYVCNNPATWKILFVFHFTIFKIYNWIEKALIQSLYSRRMKIAFG